MSDDTKNNLPVESDSTIDEAVESFTDIVSDLALPDPIQKNLLKAIDRILCAIIDIPVQKLQEGPAERRAILEERIKFIRAVNAQNMQHIEADPEFAVRASKTFTHRVLREQLNLEKIFSFAIDIFRKKKYDNSADQQADNQAEETISPDWFNTFEKEASQKSTEDMQIRFAKVLAGEIEKPGSHSIKAVKVLGDMDRRTADLFQKLCSVCIVLGVPVEKVIIDIKVPAIGGNPGQNSLSKYGLSFKNLNILNEYGLIISDYNSYNDYHLSIANKNNRVTIPFQHQERFWVLKPSTERAEGNEFRVPGVRISNVGQKLFHIVEQIPMPQFTQELKEFFKKQNLQMLEAPAPVVEYTP